MTDDELIERLAEALWLADGYDLNADPTSRTAREMRPEYERKARALLPVVAEREAEAERRGGERALRVVRLVERDMAEQALNAWSAAEARHGLSDEEALLYHADALTRWSERLRMAMAGDDYRGGRGGEMRGTTE